MPEKFNPRHRTFVQEYLKDANATQAAIRAGYSPRTAQEQASRLLKRPDISGLIRDRTEFVAKEAELDAVWTLKEMRRNYDLALQDNRFGDAIRLLSLIDKHLSLAYSRGAEAESPKTIHFDFGLPPFIPGSADPSSPDYDDYLRLLGQIKRYYSCLTDEEKNAPLEDNFGSERTNGIDNL